MSNYKEKITRRFVAYRAVEFKNGALVANLITPPPSLNPKGVSIATPIISGVKQLEKLYGKNVTTVDQAIKFNNGVAGNIMFRSITSDDITYNPISGVRELKNTIPRREELRYIESNSKFHRRYRVYDHNGNKVSGFSAKDWLNGLPWNQVRTLPLFKNCNLSGRSPELDGYEKHAIVDARNKLVALVEYVTANMSPVISIDSKTKELLKDTILCKRHFGSNGLKKPTRVPALRHIEPVLIETDSTKQRCYTKKLKRKGIIKLGFRCNRCTRITVVPYIEKYLEYPDYTVNDLCSDIAKSLSQPGFEFIDSIENILSYILNPQDTRYIVLKDRIDKTGLLNTFPVTVNTEDGLKQYQSHGLAILDALNDYQTIEDTYRGLVYNSVQQSNGGRKSQDLPPEEDLDMYFDALEETFTELPMNKNNEVKINEEKLSLLLRHLYNITKAQTTEMSTQLIITTL